VLIKNKKNKIFAMLFFVVFCFSYQKPVKAYWGDAIPATIMHEAWLEAKEAFKGAMLASLKQQANNLIRDRIRVLLTGRGGNGSLVITDYDDFIYGQAQRDSYLYTRDFFRVLGDGVGDATGAMYDNIEEALLAPESELSTIDHYVQGGLENVFNSDKGGGRQAVIAMVSNDYNNPFGTYLRASQYQQNQKERIEKQKEVEIIAGQGFASKKSEENNLINLPGSLIASLTAKAESGYMDMINNATSLPEIVGTMAAGMLSKTIETGIIKVTSPIDQQLKSIHDNADGGIREVQRDIYGGFGTLEVIRN
jgi:hypothetical protein